MCNELARPIYAPLLQHITVLNKQMLKRWQLASRQKRLSHIFNQSGSLMSDLMCPPSPGAYKKFAMGGGLFWGSKGGAPSARKFCIILEKELTFRAILIKNIAFKTWHRNWQRNVRDSTGCINGLCGKWLMITLQFSCLHAGKS